MHEIIERDKSTSVNHTWLITIIHESRTAYVVEVKFSTVFECVMMDGS